MEAICFILNDVSPLCIHNKADIEKKELKGFFLGNDIKVGLKVPYLERVIKQKKM
jgi:peptide/nickel transport system permease protein